VPTLQKTDDALLISVPTSGKSLEDLLSKEWLLTNSRGGYASSTIIGCNTSRYHGLLVGSLNPPANRIMALANCLEMVICRGKVFYLSTFEFNDKFSPEGFSYIKQFRRDLGVHFDYQLDGLELTKSLYLLRDADTLALVYDFKTVDEPVEFAWRPFVGLRNFHSLQKSYVSFDSRQLQYGLLIRANVSNGCELFLGCPAANFEKDEQWWFNFVYRNDRQRGQDFTEDLWTPGFFKCRIDSPAKVVFWGSLSSHCQPKQLINSDIEKVREELRSHQDSIIAVAETADQRLKTLCLAADQFVTKRQTGHEYRTTVLAGFPWFVDWGRDAFVALPGLLLSGRRFDEAKSVLTTFAAVTDEGMIPNRFDDYSDTAYFNSIDASLWFINAAFQYLNAAGDSKTFTQLLLPTIRWIIDSYHNGTRFDIHADTDGLITGGNKETQLTWMDAKYEGVAFTPRYGKAVEINALWYNSLCLLAQFYGDRDKDNAEHYHCMADKVKAGFGKLFWNPTLNYLNDCILPDGSVDASLRPNQIFAVSLPFSALTAHQQKAVVDVMQKNLLTPFGLRTLNVQNASYKGIYAGPQKQRDEAYHQGTVWPYLIGPFVEAYLKVNNFSQKSKRQALEFIEPLMQHLTEAGCLGQICEIFDGDPPHKPRGCVAQAWSVAELIRAYQLIIS
jgi:predicted glycogen debranching enzyme